MKYASNRLFDILNMRQSDPTFCDNYNMSATQADFYSKLIPTFTHKQAVYLGIQLGLHTRTVENYLNDFISIGLLTRTERGRYAKPVVPVAHPQNTAYPFNQPLPSSLASSPRFSVIIPLYNKAPYIEKTLQSVFAQTFTDYEIVVIDDGSTDNSYSLADQLLSTHNSHPATQTSNCAPQTPNSQIHNPHTPTPEPHTPNYQLLRQPNSGVSTARNNAVLASHGQYLCFLDADDWWEPTFLQQMDLLIRNYPDAGIYGTNYNIISDFNNRTRVAPIGVEPDFHAGYINYCQVYAKTLAMPLWTGAVSIPRPIFDQYTGFKPNLKLGEDFDLWVRIALNHKVAFLNTPLSNYFQDLPASHRATHHLHAPEHHMLWNLDYLEPYERSNPDYKQLIDNLRAYGLQNHYLSRQYHSATLPLLAKIDWSRQPSRYRRFYRLPLFYLRLKHRFLSLAVRLKRRLISLKHRLLSI